MGQNLSRRNFMQSFEYWNKSKVVSSSQMAASVASLGLDSFSETKFSTACGLTAGRTAPVIALDIFQTDVTAIRWRKWFTEIGQIITLTGQIHGRPYYYQSCTSKHKAFSPPPPKHARTHTHRRTRARAHTHTPSLIALRFCFCFFKNRLPILFPVHAYLIR